MDKILLALAELKAFLTSRSDHETKLSSAQAELVSLQGQLAAANALVASRDTAVAALTAELSQAKSDLVAQSVAAAKVTAQLVTESKRTDETLAALGVDPKLIPAAPAPASNAKTLNRLAFSALSPSEQSTFCRNGGKLTE